MCALDAKRHAVDLIRQGLTLLEGIQDEDQVHGAAALARIERIGRMAYLHREAKAANGGRLTIADSRRIRREHYGKRVRASASLFGRKGEGAILYRPGRSGRVSDTDLVDLTEAGERLAAEFERIFVGRSS